jgi:hypothetical protein
VTAHALSADQKCRLVDIFGCPLKAAVYFGYCLPSRSGWKLDTCQRDWRLRRCR